MLNENAITVSAFVKAGNSEPSAWYKCLIEKLKLMIRTNVEQRNLSGLTFKSVLS